LKRKNPLLAKEIFLLRNLSKGKGIGFFQNAGFFPDFIMWIKEGISRLSFYRATRMLLEKAYAVSDKAQLHERLAELSKKWGAQTGLTKRNLRFIHYIGYTLHHTQGSLREW